MVMALLIGMKESLVPIDKAGRVVLPKHVREELAINPGDLLEVSVQGNDVTLRPKKEVTGLIKKKKALIFSSAAEQFLEPEAVEAILKEFREAGHTQIANRLPSGRRNR
jgi:AbrB family looped-hinge helix DNA binding protein